VAEGLGGRIRECQYSIRCNAPTMTTYMATDMRENTQSHTLPHASAPLGKRQPEIAIHTMYCPVTGRGLELGDCVRRGRRLVSPYADVRPVLSGSTFLLVAVVLVFALSVIDFGTPRGPIGCIAASGVLGCGVMAVVRYFKQRMAWKRRSPKILSADKTGVNTD
jgi:hypothetical protein